MSILKRLFGIHSTKDRSHNGIATSQRRLVHYTRSAEAVASILENGFLLRPNRRGLIASLTCEHALFRDREPQQFGMACFTEVPVGGGKAHREKFGNFGIGVSWEWAKRHRAQRVIYIEEKGPVYQAFQSLFGNAIREVKAEAARYPEDATRMMAFTNKAMAGVFGCTSYAALLTLYEYMQPDADSAQVEWRIVQELPDYSNYPDLASELRSARTWRINRVDLGASDVEMLICPADVVETLRAGLAPAFRNLPVHCYAE